MPSQDIAFAIGAGANTVFLAASGAFVATPDIPAATRWLQWISPCKYSYQALNIAQFAGSKYEDFLRTEALDAPGTVTKNVGVLAAFAVAIAAATALVLHFQQERR